MQVSSEKAALIDPTKIRIAIALFIAGSTAKGNLPLFHSLFRAVGCPLVESWVYRLLPSHHRCGAVLLICWSFRTIYAINE